VATDLDRIRSLIQQTDPYGPYLGAVNSISYTPREAGQESTAIGVGLGKAILAGILSAKRDERANEQLSMVNKLMPKFAENPMYSDVPEGMSGSLFSSLQQEFLEDAIERRAKREQFESEADYTSKRRMIESAVGEDFKEFPNKRADFLASGGAEELFTKSTADGIPAALIEDKPEEAIVRKDADTSLFASPGKGADKALSRYDEVLQKYGKTQADQEAAFERETAKGQIDRVNKEAEAASAAQAELQSQLIGVKDAIKDLPLQGFPGSDTSLAVGAARTLASFEGDKGKYKQYLEARAALEALPGLASQIFRKAGDGVFTDKDAELVQKRLPTNAKTQGENQALLNIIEEGAKLKADYHQARADWVQNNRTLSGFPEAWESYKAKKLDELTSTLDSLGQEPKTTIEPNVNSFIGELRSQRLSPLEALEKARAAGIVK